MAPGDDEGAGSSPVRYWVGPPPPTLLTIVTRLLELATFLLVAVWVVYYLGGVSFHPTQVRRPGGAYGEDIHHLIQTEPDAHVLNYVLRAVLHTPPLGLVVCRTSRSMRCMGKR